MATPIGFAGGQQQDSLPAISYAWCQRVHSNMRTMVGDALVAVVVFAVPMVLLRLLAVRRSRTKRTPFASAATLE